MMKEKLCYVGYNIHAEIKLAQVLNVLYWLYMDCVVWVSARIRHR